MFLIIGRFGQRLSRATKFQVSGFKFQVRSPDSAHEHDMTRPWTLHLKPETRNLKLIYSRDNSLLRHARAVRDGKIHDSIFIEGLRLCEESLKSELKIEAVIYSERLAKKQRAAD